MPCQADGGDATSCPARIHLSEDWGLDDPAKQPIEKVRVIRDQIRHGSRLVAQVERLADAVNHFHESVEKGAGYDHASRDFARIEREYQQFRGVLRRDRLYQDQHILEEAREFDQAFAHFLEHMQGRRGGLREGR